MYLPFKYILKALFSSCSIPWPMRRSKHRSRFLGRKDLWVEKQKGAWRSLIPNALTRQKLFWLQNQWRETTAYTFLHAGEESCWFLRARNQHTRLPLIAGGEWNLLPTSIIILLLLSFLHVCTPKTMPALV